MVKRKKIKSGKSSASFNNYFKLTASFIAVALAFIIPIVFIVNSPAVKLVHNLEGKMPMGVGDLTIDTESDYASLSNVNQNTPYGTLIANISCEKRGLNASAYYGLNRASLRYGAGIAGNKSGVFSDNTNTVIGGYDETYFSSLKHIKKGDKITVTAADKKIVYSVTETGLGEKGSEDAVSGRGKIIIYSIFSDFSDDSEKFYYVTAEKLSEEVISDGRK